MEKYLLYNFLFYDYHIFCIIIAIFVVAFQAVEKQEWSSCGSKRYNLGVKLGS